MQVVYTRAHLGHDVTTETVFGRQIPANEIAERAEIIRRSLESDGGFTFAEPSEHGESPIMAVHDPGLVRFVEEAWSQVEHERLDLPYLVADTYPTFRMFEGMSPEFLAGQPEPEAVGGRAGWWGLDTANPLVEGTYGAARAAVDVALTTAEIVLGGERAAYGLCRPTGPSRRTIDGRRLLLLQQRRDRRGGDRPGDGRACRDPRRRLSPRQRHPADLLAPGRRLLRLASTPIRRASTRSSSGTPTSEARATAPARTSTCRSRLARPTTATSPPSTGPSRRSPDRPGSIIVVSLGFDTYGRDPIGDFALTTPVYHEVGRRVAATGRRLVILQEGGYYRPALGDNALGWLRGAEGR